MNARVLTLLLLGGVNVLVAIWMAIGLAGTPVPQPVAPVPEHLNTSQPVEQAAFGTATRGEARQIGRLFHKPVAAPIETALLSATDAKPARPKLLGVLTRLDQDPKASIVILAFDAAGPTSRLRTGEEKNGWRLLAVRKTEVDVRNGGGPVITLSLQSR